MQLSAMRSNVFPQALYTVSDDIVGVQVLDPSRCVLVLQSIACRLLCSHFILSRFESFRAEFLWGLPSYVDNVDGHLIKALTLSWM